LAQAALTVKLKLPEEEGVPESVPVFDSPVYVRLKPAGSDPLVPKLQLVPFTTVSSCEYAMPSVAAGSVAGLKLRLIEEMSSLRIVAVALKIGVTGATPLEMPDTNNEKVSSGSTAVSPFTDTVTVVLCCPPAMLKGWAEIAV